MTNFEKYRDKLLKIAELGEGFAIVEGDISICGKVSCADCAFTNNCGAETIK